MANNRSWIREQPHQFGLAHAALFGVLLSVALALIFWATAAAQGLPAEAPNWAKNFQPAAGLARLIQSLFWIGLVGGGVFLLLALAYNIFRRATRA